MEEIDSKINNYDFLKKIANKYYYELFGTLQFYTDEWVRGGVVQAKNCSQMAQEINQAVLDQNMDSRLIAMYADQDNWVKSKPNHIMTRIIIDWKSFLIDPTLFLNSPVQLPEIIDSHIDYTLPDIIWQRSDIIHRYYKTSKHDYLREKINNWMVIKSWIFDDRPLSQDQMHMIIWTQEKIRTDLKLWKINTLHDWSTSYSKLKFSLNNDSHIILYQWRNQQKIKITDLLEWIYDEELMGSLWLTKDWIRQITSAVSNFIFYKNYMSIIDEEIKKLEQNTQRWDIDLNIIEPKYPDSKIYCYLHGLYSDKDSTKAKVIGFEWSKSGDWNMRFSFRWNGNSVSDNFQFQDMDVKSMAEDFINITQESNKLYPSNKIIPVASSLGASALLYAVKLYPELIDQYEKIILLSPSIEFAKNRRRLREIKNDIKSEQKRKNQWYLVEHHNAWECDAKINYQLFEQSLEVNLVSVLSAIKIPITIIVWRNDSVIDYQTIDSIAATNPYIDLIVVHDSHSLKQKMDLIIKSL